jgi:hypothetical protein
VPDSASQNKISFHAQAVHKLQNDYIIQLNEQQNLPVHHGYQFQLSFLAPVHLGNNKQESGEQRNHKWSSHFPENERPFVL